VDFDNFVVDPNCKEHLFRDASFTGDRLCVPRVKLLDSRPIQERPDRAAADRRPVHELEGPGVPTLDAEINGGDDNYDLEDMVEVVELYVPSANAIVTVPGTDQTSFDDYLRVDDFYGVKEGPYTFLALTPPVPGNPLPIPSVGVWHDLHVKANEMAKKIIEQASRQKDVIGYKRSGADDAEEIRNAVDGDTWRWTIPSGADVQLRRSEEQQRGPSRDSRKLVQHDGRQPESGRRAERASRLKATAATILQGNAGIGLDDMKDLVYQFARRKAASGAWYCTPIR
jgi:hypothetical protein